MNGGLLEEREWLREGTLIICNVKIRLFFQTATEKCVMNTKTATKKCIDCTKSPTKKCNDWLSLKMEGGVMSVAGGGNWHFSRAVEIKKGRRQCRHPGAMKKNI